MKFAFIGVGKIGYAAARYILDYYKPSEILLSDKEKHFINVLLQQYPKANIKTKEIDINKRANAVQALKDYDSMISCVPYYMNYGLAQIAIEAKCHYVDLGGNDTVTDRILDLKEKAKKAGISIIPDCGLAPGLVSLIAADAIRRLGKVDEILLRVGGLPQEPVPPFNYHLTFNVEGLINEYKEPVRVLEGGREKIVEPLDGLEEIEFEPYGTLEAFNTSGGISTLPRTVADKVKNLSYKTIRFPGHQAILTALKKVGFFDEDYKILIDNKEVTPRKCLEALLANRFKSNALDMVLLYCTAHQNRKLKLSYRLHDKGDPGRGLTAMQRCTALPTAIISTMQLEGNIKKKGARPQEVVVVTEIFFRKLEEWGMKLEIKEH